MKRLFIVLITCCFGSQVMADFGHAGDAQKVEVAVFGHEVIAREPNWAALKSEIYNTFSVPITLRNIRVAGASVNIEKATTVLGATVWKDIKFLQISGGGLIAFDDETYRMRISPVPKAGASIQMGLDFGPIGWKSYFYDVD